MKNTVISNSEEETFSLARELGREIKKNSVITLRGDLGSGKTVFTKGLAEGLGIKDNITSPTFSLMEIYEGEVPLYHFDLYRIENPDEFTNLSFEDYWEGDGVSVIEWPERAGNMLPEKRIDIIIEYIDENRRRITVEYTGN